ncbi:MAG: exosortase/archaeosortase family protein [Gemmataceae bacterium]
MDTQLIGVTGRLGGLTFRCWLIAAALVAVCFTSPLLALVRLSLLDDLASHTILIPFLCAYLIWTRRDDIAENAAPSLWPAAVTAAAAVVLLAIPVASGDQLSMQILALCLFAWAGGFLALGSHAMCAHAFPALFLLFMVPLPAAVVSVLETFFQHTSAAVAFQFILASGTTVLREGLVFHLPGISLEVGPECSGIRSSYALFMTALLAGHLFLRTRWTKLALALFVIPLGIVRNAFRVFVLAMLTAHVDPAYIDSPIHHQGGPLFFALSLVPFFMVVALLRRAERHS